VRGVCDGTSFVGLGSNGDAFACVWVDDGGDGSLGVVEPNTGKTEVAVLPFTIYHLPPSTREDRIPRAADGMKHELVILFQPVEGLIAKGRG
jgi:hypothetical protein